MTSYPQPDPSLDHSMIMGMGVANTTVIQQDGHLSPTSQFSGGPGVESQIDKFRARAHAAEDAMDKMFDELMAAQGQLERVLAEGSEKDKIIQAWEQQQQQQQGQRLHVGTGVGTTGPFSMVDKEDPAVQQLRFQLHELETELARLKGETVEREQAVAENVQQSLVVSHEATMRELQGLVDFFRKNSEQSARQVRELREENRRLKGMVRQAG